MEQSASLNLTDTPLFEKTPRVSLDFSSWQRHNWHYEHITASRGHKRMDTDKFDKHAKANLAFYEGFMNFSKYTVVAIVITLALMAYFLI